MDLAYAICKVAAAPLRALPGHASEMVSQLLFGEKMVVTDIDPQTGWMKVITEWDNYVGFIKEGQCTIISKNLYFKENNYINYRLNDEVVNSDGSFLLPIGSSLFNIKKNNFNWLPNQEYQGKKIKLANIELRKELLIASSLKYIGSPYLWGGRTQMGIDCSGFSQMVYKSFNVRIERDASAQAKQGIIVDFLAEAQVGDLAFFDNEEEKITHVGMLLSPTEIIHATDSSGCVVIDTIDNGGIISRLHRKRTHKLRIIKRITEIPD